MALEARVVSGYRWSSVVALEGTEFIKSEFRPVPITREEEARNTRFLEVREKPEAQIEIKITDESADAVDEKAKAIADFLAQSARPIIAYVKEAEIDDAPKSVEFLEAAYAAEADGKKRVTVLKAITARLGEIDAGGE